MNLKKICFCIFLVIGIAAAVTAQTLPEWASGERDVWVEDGVIYARGSAKMATLSMSLTTARTRARSNLSKALANGEITGFPSIPADTKTRSTFTFNGISVEVGNIAETERFIADDGAAHVLLACNGAETVN